MTTDAPPSTRGIHVRLDLETFDKLVELEKQDASNWSAVVRKAIRRLWSMEARVEQAATYRPAPVDAPEDGG